MRVKICGITTADDALAAAAAGADAIGLNFVGGPRQIGAEQAAEILDAIPPLVTPVALIRLEQGRMADELVELLGQFWVSHVQVYGEVTPGGLTVLANDGFRAFPVVAVADETFAQTVNDWLARMGGRKPAGIVLDAYAAGQLGGTGKTFRWDWVTRAAADGSLENWPPIVLAGGLTPDNVAEAIAAVRPYAVDVSSGVEAKDRPGTKDAARMRSFIHNARHAKKR